METNMASKLRLLDNTAPIEDKELEQLRKENIYLTNKMIHVLKDLFKELEKKKNKKVPQLESSK